MKRTGDETIQKGASNVGRHRISSAFRLGFLLLLFSCEIEDDFGKPDFSSKLGTLIYTSQYNPIYKILWSEQINSIIALGTTVTVIDVDTKTSKQLNLNNFSYEASGPSWLVGDTFYYLDYNAGLSSVDIKDGTQKISLTDSIITNYQGLPYSRNHFAFNKSIDFYQYEPKLYLYDLETQKENLIASGSPIVFSPDGQYLLFSKIEPSTNTRVFYSYSVPTKAIETLAIQDPSTQPAPIKWTIDGILFYYQNYNGSGNLEVFNATTRRRLGEWLTSGTPINHGVISPSGKKVMTFLLRCATRGADYTNYCDNHKGHYYLVDIPNGKEVEMIYGPNMFDLKFAFSPDENRAVYILANDIYLLELTE